VAGYWLLEFLPCPVGYTIRLPRTSVWLPLTILLLLALLAMNIYRARRQSITIDEAFTYNVYVDAPAENILKIWDANNHVLHTFLCRISVWLFGRSELAVRIPSLLGGLLYMVTILRICRYVFGDGWYCFLSFALLCMSPAVLDYMSAARGYGLAMAFFFWSMLAMLRWREDPTALEKASAGLALSVASNLTFVFPGAALALVFGLLLARERKGRAALDRFLVPGTVLAFSALVLPLIQVDKNSFYFGEKSMAASLDSVLRIAWMHHTYDPLRLTGMLWGLLWWAKIVVPAVLLVAALMCCRKGASPVLILTAGSLIGCVFLLIAGHRALQLLYPIRRTGLYWIPLFLLTSLLLIWAVLQKNRFAAAPLLAIAILFLAQFVSQLCVRHYAEWPGDASNRRIVQEIRKHHALHAKTAVRVATATWQLEEGLNYYRRLFRLDWMQPIDRKSLDGPCDYYIALPADAGPLEKLALTRIYQDLFTEAILAVPSL
jgi:hypothetical protein